MTIINLVKEMSKKISGKLFYEYDMRHLNWFNLGGPAKVFYKPNKLEELIFFLKELSVLILVKIKFVLPILLAWKEM